MPPRKSQKPRAPKASAPSKKIETSDTTAGTGTQTGGAVRVGTAARPDLAATEDGRSSASAVLTFLSNWQQLQHGPIVAGGSLVLQYEPARLSDRGVSNDGGPDWGIVGYARFLPGGQLETVNLLRRAQGDTAAPGGTHVPVAAEIPVPPDAQEVELWFQRVGSSTDSCWDSRFGENYRYPVIPAGPTPASPVRLRAGAVIDPDTIRVTEDAAVKNNATPSRPGYPSSQSILQTRLHIGAWVKAAAGAEEVWIDVHVFDGQGALVHSATLPLRLAGPAGDDGELYLLDEMLYQGAVASPGAVSPKPDVRRLQYRVYCEANGQVFTDGRLHTCELATDVVSR